MEDAELMKTLNLTGPRAQQLHEMFEISGDALPLARVIHLGLLMVTDPANRDTIAARYRARYLRGGGAVVAK
jgi:hypothetical protein